MSLPVRTVFLAHGTAKTGVNARGEQHCYHSHNEIRPAPCSTEDGAPPYMELEDCDAISENLVGCETADQSTVNTAVLASIAKKRTARGETMTGGKKPTDRTFKNYKAKAATGPNATVRSVAFSTSDMREVAGKSILSNVTFEIGLAVALYTPVPPGTAARKLKVVDELADKVCDALGVSQVRYHRYHH